MIYASSNINLNISNQNNNPLASYRAAIIENNQVAVEQCAVALVNKYSSSIYRQGLKIWYGRPERFQLADELTQVTLIKICASAKSYRPEMNPRTWIYAITANSARDMARHANALKRQSKPLSNIGSKAIEKSLLRSLGILVI